MSQKSLVTLKKIIMIIVGVTLLIGAVYLLISWNRPINPALEIPDNNSEEPRETLADNINEEIDNQSGEVTQSTLEPVCGGPPTMTVLVTGVASKNYLYGLADAIRVARIDFQTQKVTVLALPRDVWIEIPGLENRGITVGKLNQAYFYGTEGMGYYSGAGFGSGLLAESLFLNFGLTADHYLSVSLSSFRKIINTLGGVDVYLPQDVYKRVNDQPVLFLKAGSHHLNGKQAEMLAQQRISIGDFGRINNQTLLLKAIAVQLLSPSGIAAIPTIIEQVQSNVLMDFSPAEITQLICLAGMIDFQEDLKFVSLPQNLMIEQLVYDPARGINTAALVSDKDKIRVLINDFQAGIWP